jgi:hypothetical protein
MGHSRRSTILHPRVIFFSTRGRDGTTADDARPRTAHRRARHGETTDNPGGDEGRRPGGTAAELRWWEFIFLAAVGPALAAQPGCPGWLCPAGWPAMLPPTGPPPGAVIGGTPRERARTSCSSGVPIARLAGRSGIGAFGRRAGIGREGRREGAGSAGLARAGRAHAKAREGSPGPVGSRWATRGVTSSSCWGAPGRPGRAAGPSRERPAVALAA